MRMKSRAGSIVARERAQLLRQSPRASTAGARPARLVREHFVPEPKRRFHAVSSFGEFHPIVGAHLAGGFHGGGPR
jgi:hypothetical protein